MPERERGGGLYSLSSGVLWVPDRGRIYDGVPVRTATDPGAILVHELVHFFQTLESPYLLEFAVQRYFVLKAVQRRIRGITLLSRTPFNIRARVSVEPSNCMYRLLDHGGGRFGLSVRDLAEGAAFYYQFASVASHEVEQQACALGNAMRELVGNITTRRYGIAYYRLWQAIAARYGRGEASSQTFHFFPILVWLALRPWRLGSGRLAHPGNVFEYFLDMLRLHPPITAEAPPATDASLQAAATRAGMFLELVRHDGKLIEVPVPEMILRQTATVHRLLDTQLGAYQQEFQLLRLARVWARHWGTRDESLAYVVSLHDRRIREMLLKVVSPHIRDRGGFRPARPDHGLLLTMALSGAPVPDLEFLANPSSRVSATVHAPPRVRKDLAATADVWPSSLQPLELHVVEDIVDTLETGIYHKSICPHSQCPRFGANLCRRWPYIPMQGHFRECEFPDWLSLNFGSSGNQVGADRDPLEPLEFLVQVAFQAVQ